MALTFREVDQIMRIVEEFPADEVRFEYGDLKLHVRRDGAGRSEAPATPAASIPPIASAPAQTPAAPPHASAAMAVAAAPAAAAAPVVARDGLVPVVAPMMGVFYSAPAPDAPPFVTVGQQVSESTDLCIIEVMKVMNSIKSPCAGRVVEVTVVNGDMVERGAAIFWIEPAR